MNSHPSLLSRRSILRGMTASIALPLLPSLSRAQESAASQPVSRFAFVTFGNGVHPRAWTARRQGREVGFGQALRPLIPFGGETIALDGMHLFDRAQIMGPDPYIYGFTPLLSTAPFDPETLTCGVSVDQFMAAHTSRETPVHSIQAAIGPFKRSPLKGLPSWAAHTVSWRTAQTPLPPLTRPSVLFEMLFGRARTRRTDSVFDQVLVDLNRIKNRVSPEDADRLEAYTEAVRGLEKQLFEQTDTEAARPQDNLQDINLTVRQFNRLIALAFEADITRVASFVLTPDLSDRSFDFIDGVPDTGLYTLSRYGTDREKINAFVATNTWHAERIAELAGDLKNIAVADGTLLDHTLLTTVPSMSDSQSGTADDLLALVIGGSATGLRTGQYIKVRAQPEKRLSNLYLTLLNKMGIETSRFGNSWGPLLRLG